MTSPPGRSWYFFRHVCPASLKGDGRARDTGIDRGTITRLYHETAERKELEVIEKLCAYLRCDLSEFMEIVDSSGSQPD